MTHQTLLSLGKYWKLFPVTLPGEDVHSVTTSQDEDTEKCALVSRIHFSELRMSVLEEKTH